MNIRELTAVAMLIAGVAMAFTALLMPPGEIHDSVLWIFAQILLYAGSALGIDAYVRKRLGN